MDDSKWLEFLDRIAIDKKLTTIQKTTLKAKFPTFNGMVNDRDLLVSLNLETPTTLKKRLGVLYKIFGLLKDLDNKAIALQAYLQQESPKPPSEKDKESVVENLTSLRDASRTTISESTQTPPIEWRKECEELLNIQKQQLTSSPLQQRQARSLDEVHVPLGLVERKEKSLPKFDRAQEFSPDKGSEAYHQSETKPIEHDAFLAAVRDRQPGQHLVILGEPGAGKTTLLTKVWQSLLENVDRDEDTIVAWVPLAAVGDRLEDYLKQVWLRKVCDDEDLATYWESFRSLRQNGRVWLLLDGADEMGGDALRKIETTLQENWARSIRAIVTCRLNLWDASPMNSLNSSPNFQIYRTLDFKYAPKDMVGEFIGKWFKDKAEVGKKLRSALDEAGKERIKDLVQNPLRLTLLCEIWEDKPELPDTQAQLYGKFVDRVHKLNAAKFPRIKVPKIKLEQSMGDLAKWGINKPMLRFRFDEGELADVTHYEALKALGWLNCVGKDDDDREVYAFFHPTFQEYFAACAIDDWDYFLPRAHDDRPVPCQGEDVPTYRVFEQEWRQVILLWIGRRDEDVADKLKEEFIDRLTNFREQEGKFYYYRAYFMAAICVSEFKYSRRAEAIVEQIVRWTFGDFQTEENSWGDLHPIPWMAEAELLHTDTNRVVDSIARNIIPVSINSLHPNKDAAFKSARILGLLGRNNPRAVKALIELIQCSEELIVSFFFVRIEASKSLAKIATGNEQAIYDLKDILSVNQNKEIQMQIVSCIGTLDPKNQFAVNFFATAINDAENENDKLKAAWSILSFDEQNDIAVNTLTDLVGSSDSNVSYDAVKILEQGSIITYDNEEYEYSQDEIDNAKEICRNSRSIFDLLCDNILSTSQLAFGWGLHEIQRHLELDYKRAVDELCWQLHTNQDITALQSIIEILGSFSIGDEKVVKELIVFLKNGNFLLLETTRIFNLFVNSSSSKQLCHLIIGNLKYYVQDLHFSQDLHFNQIYTVIWMCVRRMRYQDFHQALHSEINL
jgi:NACHT domain